MQHSCPAEARAKKSPKGRGQRGAAQPLVMVPAMVRYLGMAPSLGCLNRERRGVDAVFVLELEKKAIGSRRRNLDAEANRFG
jgi:hypothetical protein